MIVSLQEYLTRLVDLLNGLKRYKEGQVYAKLAMEVVPDNPALFLIGGYMMLMCGDMEGSKKPLNKAATMDNEGLAAKVINLSTSLAETYYPPSLKTSIDTERYAEPV